MHAVSLLLSKSVNPFRKKFKHKITLHDIISNNKFNMHIIHIYNNSIPSGKSETNVFFSYRSDIINTEVSFIQLSQKQDYFRLIKGST